MFLEPNMNGVCMLAPTFFNMLKWKFTEGCFLTRMLKWHDVTELFCNMG